MQVVSRFLPALILVVAACQSEIVDNSGVGDPPMMMISFKADIGPLLAASCSGAACHVGMRTSGVRLDSYQNIVTSVGEQYGGFVVIAEDTAGSPLLDKITPLPDFGSRMPLGRSPLSADQIARITEWIRNGALNN